MYPCQFNHFIGNILEDMDTDIDKEDKQPQRLKRKNRDAEGETGASPHENKMPPALKR